MSLPAGLHVLVEGAAEAASAIAGQAGQASVPWEVTDAQYLPWAKLARSHFKVATALILLWDRDRLGLVALDGRRPEILPADLSGVASGLLPAAHLHSVKSATVVVPDTSSDARFNNATGGWPRFYAASGLTAADGRHVGVLCLLDDMPREFEPAQRCFLSDLADLISTQLELTSEISGLRQQVTALHDDSELMSLALEVSGTGVWDRNIATGEIAYSPTWKAILGYREQELGNRIEDAFLRLHPDDLAHVQETMRAHFENQSDSYAVEHRIRCKDGSYKWICSRGKVVERDNDGRARRMVGTTTDITALREMAATLRQTIDLVTNLTDEVPGLVFQFRAQGDGRSNFPYASHGIQEIYELSAAQVALDAQAVDRLIDPRDRTMYHESLKESAASLAPWHLEYRVQLPRQGLRWRQGDARPSRLADGSTLWHGFITDVTDRKHIEAELQEFATIDFLTQLPNRRHFMMQSEAELARIQRTACCVAAVLMFDLDHFKVLNDTWGHAVGDCALRHFATLLRAETRADDIVGRLGGEEFAMVLPDTDYTVALEVAERLQARILQTPLLHHGQTITLSVSIGVDLMRATDLGSYQSLSRADRALYRAKAQGRNRIEVYGES